MTARSDPPAWSQPGSLAAFYRRHRSLTYHAGPSHALVEAWLLHRRYDAPFARQVEFNTLKWWVLGLRGEFTAAATTARALTGNAHDYRPVIAAFEQEHGGSVADYARFIADTAPHTRRWAQRLVRVRAYLATLEAA